jgi:hypothetical protein
MSAFHALVTATLSCTATRTKLHLLVANKSFENAAEFMYLGTAVTNQNYIHEEMKSSLNSGNAGCRSVEKLLSFRLLSRNLKIKI